VITIGIDPHKASHTAVALDESGAEVGQVRVVADKAIVGRLQRWAAGWPQRRWAVEGAGGLGRLLAQQLVASGEAVVDVPSALASRARVLQRGHGRKTDGIDAASVARVAQGRDDLAVVVADDHRAVLRLLSDRRDELTGERRRAVNRLHRLLRDLRPGGAPLRLSADRAARLLTTLRPTSVVDKERKAMAPSSSPTSVASTCSRPTTAAVAGRPSRHRAPRSRRCLGSATCWRPRSSDTPATSLASPTPITTPATPAHRRSRSQAANTDDTASHARATDCSTMRCTSPLESRRCTPGQDARITCASRPSRRPLPRRCVAPKRQLAKVVYRHLRDDHRRQAIPVPLLT
jgi:hypothetical protein